MKATWCQWNNAKRLYEFAPKATVPSTLASLFLLHLNSSYRRRWFKLSFRCRVLVLLHWSEEPEQFVKCEASPKAEGNLYFTTKNKFNFPEVIGEIFKSATHCSFCIGLMVSAVSWIVVRRKGEIFEAINMSIYTVALVGFNLKFR